MLRRRRFVSSTLLAAVLASISLFAAPTPGEGTITGAEMVPGSSAAPPPLAASSDASVRFLREGLTGSIVAAIQSVDLTGDGVAEAFVGTSGGLYVLSQGSLLQYIPTSSAVTDLALLDDVSGDGKPDVVVAVADTFFPNIRVYDIATGQRVWQFVPKQEVFVQNLMWTAQQTPTFDVEAADVNGDGVKDVLATSGYRVYALDGLTGDALWDFEADDNLWRVSVTPDLTGDGTLDLAVGGQNGYMHVLNGRDGDLLWEKRLTEKYEAKDEKGGSWKDVDRSAWDIVPVHVRDTPMAVVSSEDGSVRLIDLRDGSVDWDVQVIDYVEALLDRYYQRKNGQASSPGDFHFFNLRVFPIGDATRDGIEEVLVSAHLGREAEQGQEPRGAGLLVLDVASGSTVWKNTALSLGQVGQMEITTLEEKPVVLLPSAKIDVIGLEDGVITDTIEVAGAVSSRTRNRYAIKDLGEGEMLVVSDIRDALGISTSGKVLWDYPRVSSVAVERGDFTGDDTQDILVRSKTYSKNDGSQEAKSRVVYVVDGMTKEKVWTYTMSHEEFAATGGIGGILATPDLDGDGKQDIVGHVQEPETHDGKPYAGIAEILALSGKDGAVIFRQPVTTQTYYGIWEALYDDPSIIERRIRDRFEAEMAREFPRQSAEQEQQRLNDSERQIDDDWNRVEGELRSQLQGEIADQWENEQRQLWEQFDQRLQDETDGLRDEGKSDEQVAQYQRDKQAEFDQDLQEAQQEAEATAWNRFEQDLPEQRARAAEEWREGFLEQLAREKEDTRRDWVEGFERDQLPQELEQWRERLDQEVQGHRIDRRIVSLDIMRDHRAPAGVSLLVAGPRDIYILSAEGELLWTRTTEPWTYQDPFDQEAGSDMEFSLKAGHGTQYRVPGDLNSDGIDDLVAFTGERITVGLSSLEDGQFNILPGADVEVERGMDPRQGTLVNDLDGDGAKDIAYPSHVPDSGPLGVFLSSATGRTLMELADYDPSNEDFNNVTLDLDVADMNRDGNTDALIFQRWIEGVEGARLRVISTRSEDVIWDFSGYKETYLFDQYQGPIMPAASISDLTGDGVAELALVRNLTWQSGARLEIYDVVTGALEKQIVLENVDSERNRDERWHPGLLVQETDDLNGDGTRELAVVTWLGEDEQRKEPRLMVVDPRQEQVVADFRVLGTDLLDLEGTSEFGLVGTGGEVFLLNVTNDLQVDVVGAGGSGSPLTVTWTGVAPGAFNQVFVDNIEVARTNENEATVAVSNGDHDVTVRSLDEFGRGIYRTASFTVEKESLVVVWAFAGTAALLLLVLWFPISTLARRLMGREANRG